MEQDSGYLHELQAKGIRPSQQRLAIYAYVKQHRTHPTTDAVYTALSPDYPTLSRTTVYNTLHLFCERGLIQKVCIEDEEIRYDAELREHIHFKCSCCGEIFDIFSEKIPAMFRDCRELLPPAFRAARQEMTVWGTCPQCRSRTEAE
ncbi:MAG TPA: transcriptional repressor [Treponema sp.]|nr:transcriptional repressor [Treponema sp.]